MPFQYGSISKFPWPNFIILGYLLLYHLVCGAFANLIGSNGCMALEPPTPKIWPPWGRDYIIFAFDPTVLTKALYHSGRCFSCESLNCVDFLVLLMNREEGAFDTMSSLFG
jgi:hypothetical protein